MYRSLVVIFWNYKIEILIFGNILIKVFSYSKIVNSRIIKEDPLENGNKREKLLVLFVLVLFELLQESIYKTKSLKLKNKKLREDKKWFDLPSRCLAYDLYNNNIYLLLSTTGTELGTWHVLPLVFINIIYEYKVLFLSF